WTATRRRPRASMYANALAGSRARAVALSDGIARLLAFRDGVGPMLAAPGRRATPEEDDMSWVAIIVAGVVSMGLGALWFSPLMFAKPWTAMRVDKAPMSG